MLKFVICFLILSSTTFANNIDGFPIRFIGGCEADFNNDKKSDKALLLEISDGIELIALIAEKSNYQATVLYKGVDKNLFVTCEYIKNIKGSLTQDGNKSKEYLINSFVIRLTQPEGSSSIYYWKNCKFEQVWTSD